MRIIKVLTKLVVMHTIIELCGTMSRCQQFKTSLKINQPEGFAEIR